MPGLVLDTWHDHAFPAVALVHTEAARGNGLHALQGLWASGKLPYNRLFVQVKCAQSTSDLAI